eukprot:TRINITY_DN6996_c0_g1_i5.p2 TRINITY_DN6996_c0_g1~~TRINITY_DN6996_c0_g1_i5.p2  ORF type:complete len:102 (+),score=31.57 TRINITY_DN6996_c0_g1_i5:269-574(+)
MINWHGEEGSSGCSDVEKDVAKLKTAALQVLAETGVGQVALPDDVIAEMCRFAASELHTTAAVMGGVAAQEAIKVLTWQFVPVAGTLVYNGINSSFLVMNI